MKHKAQSADSASSETCESVETLLVRLQAAGAERADALGWHYIQRLAERARSQPGPVQALLQRKLHKALLALQARLACQDEGPRTQHNAGATTTTLSSSRSRTSPPSTPSPPSPLAGLLHDMGHPPASEQLGLRPAGSVAESTQVHQLRQQLRRIGVQKQVSQAMASGPHNAGPINPHMLVLRALGLLQEISPDYLNRFMVHLDTLLCLHDHQPQKGTSGVKPMRPRRTVK